MVEHPPNRAGIKSEDTTTDSITDIEGISTKDNFASTKPFSLQDSSINVEINPFDASIPSNP